MKSKTLRMVPRSPQSTLFQTALGGNTCVPTAMEAHFDPYAEAPATLSRTRGEMEAVPRVEINGANEHSPAPARG